MEDTMLICVPEELRYRRMVVRAIAAACRMARGEDRQAYDHSDDVLSSVPPELRPARANERPEEEEALDLSNPFDAEMVTAVSEAFNHIASRPCRDGEEAGVVIEAHIDRSSIAVLIRDDGKSLGQGSERPSEIGTLTEGEVGLFILRSCVDEFFYRPGSPNLWLLKKQLPARQVVAGTTGEPMSAELGPS